MPELNLAHLRTDVARLLHESPDTIGDDDNLMDLGLDSMRLMKLVSQWRTHGVQLEFSDLASEATLAHWWSLIRAQTKNHPA